MKGIESVRARIRFHLGELAARNEHHGFERLCMELARHRVCTNILPATGPVSAGGDQGRDFETFKTYLQRSGLGQSAFLGLVSEGFLVFACSTQQRPEEGKIKADVTKILAGGSRPDRIYFYSAHNIPIGKRHE